MPRYRYECLSCHQEFVTLVMPSAESEVRCDNCGSAELNKLPPRSFCGKSTSGSGTRPLGGGCSSCSARTCRGCRM